MLETMNRLSGNVRSRSVESLAESLVQLSDLERQAKIAHWNVRGPNFAALHTLFDQVATEVRGFADTVAERLVALGGTADARSQTVTAQTRLADYPVQAQGGDQHIEAIATALAIVGNDMREGIEQCAGWGDPVTSDIFGEIARGIDKQLWLVEAHRIPQRAARIAEASPRRRMAFASQDVY